MDAPPVFEIEIASFQHDVIERSRQVPVVVLFWTAEVAPAADTKNVLERLARQYQGKFALALSDVARDQTLAQQLRVQGIPSIRVIRDGQLWDQLDGPQGEAALRGLIDALIQSPADLLKEQLAVHLANDDFDSALAVVQEALRAEPGNVGFRVELADLLLVKGDEDGARKILASIPEDAPERERPATRLELMEEAATLGELSIALTEVAADASNLEARYRAAVLLAVDRRYAEALDQALAILQRDRAFREDAGRLTMVRVMAVMGKGDDVAKRYRRRMFNFLY